MSDRASGPPRGPVDAMHAPIRGYEGWKITVVIGLAVMSVFLVFFATFVGFEPLGMAMIVGAFVLLGLAGYVGIKIIDRVLADPLDQ